MVGMTAGNEKIYDAVEEYHIAGEVTATDKSKITGLLEEYLSNPLVAPWYSGEYKVLNEIQCTPIVTG